MEVVLGEEAQEELIHLPPSVNARMLEVFKRLESWPSVSGAKALKGDLSGQYRIRTGDYRIRFKVEQGRILVLQVGHRDGFYE